MKPLILGLMATAAVGCGGAYVPPPRDEKASVELSIEYPSVVGGGVPKWDAAHVRIRNKSAGTIKAIRDFTQGVASDTSRYKFKVYDARGTELKQK